MPLTSNFVGEFLILYGLITEKMFLSIFFVSIAIFLCAIYSIWLYNKIIFGLPNYKYASYLTDINKLEFFLLFPIFLVILLIGIYPKIFFDIFLLNLYYYFNFMV